VIFLVLRHTAGFLVGFAVARLVGAWVEYRWDVADWRWRCRVAQLLAERRVLERRDDE